VARCPSLSFSSSKTPLCFINAHIPDTLLYNIHTIFPTQAIRTRYRVQQTIPFAKFARYECGRTTCWEARTHARQKKKEKQARIHVQCILASGPMQKSPLLDSIMRHYRRTLSNSGGLGFHLHVIYMRRSRRLWVVLVRLVDNNSFPDSDLHSLPMPWKRKPTHAHESPSQSNVRPIPHWHGQLPSISNWYSCAIYTCCEECQPRPLVATRYQLTSTR
jgi:hypothetical protein